MKDPKTQYFKWPFEAGSEKAHVKMVLTIKRT